MSETYLIVARSLEKNTDAIVKKFASAGINVADVEYEEDNDLAYGRSSLCCGDFNCEKTIETKKTKEIQKTLPYKVGFLDCIVCDGDGGRTFVVAKEL